MRWKSHVRFGGRTWETHRSKDRQGAHVRPTTYVSTWFGWVYVAFVIDAYSRWILGWRSATTMTTKLVLDAIEHAIWTRKREGVQDFSGLIHHNDRGSQRSGAR